MSMLSFLKSAKLEEVEEKKRPSGATKEFNPNPAVLAIRVWRDGRVYPSQALVDKFNLEYQSGRYETKDIPEVKDDQGNVTQPAGVKRVFTPSETPGNGFDVIDSRLLVGYHAEGHMLFIGAVPKTEGKVDLFSTTRYKEDGSPMTTVMSQAAATFGKDVLVSAIRDIYGVELGDKKEYVDMMIVDEIEGVKITETFSKPIIYAPKRVVRGANQGKPDYVRRENMTLYGFVPQELLSEADAAEKPETTA